MVVSEMEADEAQAKSSTLKALDECSDEEYLIMRAKIETEKGNISVAKTWMLTARAIYPSNFDVQFEAYMSEKKAGNVRECSKCLQVLFDNFPKQTKLLDEIHLLMKVLRKKQPESECVEGDDKFYLDMFDNISGEHQKKMIRFAADKASDPLEHCKLMLVLLRKFSDEISNHGEKLIETINTAEIREVGQVGDPLNQFRTVLCTEILPTVLSDSRLKMDANLVLANLYRVQEYVMASALRPGPGAAWPLLYDTLSSVSRLLSWLPSSSLPPVSLTGTSLPTEQILSLLSSQGKINFHILASVVLHTVTEYTAASQNSILVEAWVTHTSHMDREKNKRRKTQDEVNLSHVTGDGDLVRLFRLAAESWSLLTSQASLQSQFQSLVSQLAISLGQAKLNMFDNFRVDFQHCYIGGRVMDLLGLVRSETNSHRPAWQAIKTATLQYFGGEQRSAAQSLMAGAAELPASSDITTDETSLSAGLTLPTNKTRHCRFIQLTRPAVLTYCCKLLTSLLQEKAMFPGAGGDLARGHCMVLLQYNWTECTDNRELFYHLLNSVRGKDGFTYPLFCKYVINIEMLEEIMFLASEQGGGLVMDILPGSWAGGAGARPGTRGANRGEREEFRSAMRRQAARSLENIEDIIADFLSTESSLILQTLA